MQRRNSIPEHALKKLSVMHIIAYIPHAETGGIFARTDTFKNSFYPYSILEEYNKMNISLRLRPPVEQLKQILVGNIN